MNTRWGALAGVVALCAGVVAQGTDWVEKRSAYDRERNRDAEAIVSARDRDGDAPESGLRFPGRLVATDGRPLVGLPVEMSRQTVYTDEEGRFEVVSEYMIDDLSIPTPSGKLYVASKPWFRGVDLDTLPSHYNVNPETLPPRVVVDFNRPFEAEFETFRRIDLVVTGEREGRIDYRWLDWKGWRRITADLLRRVLGKSDAQTLVRTTVPGRIDRLVAYPPATSKLIFDYNKDEPHRLAVVDDGMPVSGAEVEIVDAATPVTLRLEREDPQTPLLVYRAATDAMGRVSVAGDPDGLYVAYVYADGYEPARVRLAPGRETRVNLSARDVEMRFAGLRPGEVLRIKLAGRDTLVKAVPAVAHEPISVLLAPGSYDAAVEDAVREVVSGTTFTVAQGSGVVDLGQDRRPKVVLSLPDSRGSKRALVGATRRTLVHSHISLAKYLAEWRESGVGEAPAEVEVVDDATRVLRFPGTGRWSVQVRWGAYHSFFAEVDLVAGEVRELRLPSPDAAIEGTMTYKLDLDSLFVQMHAIAGPRMVLVATGDAGTRWNVMSHYDRKPNTFAIDALPAGDYLLFHHLADHLAWGGREVSLARGASTRVEGLGSDRPARLVVDVVDAAGRPVRDRVLRIRDRMHKRWTPRWGELFYTGGPIERIPWPPAVPLKGEPVAFESIRAGWLELVVDDPAGDARHYLREVVPGRTLRLVADG